MLKAFQLQHKHSAHHIGTPHHMFMKVPYLNNVNGPTNILSKYNFPFLYEIRSQNSSCYTINIKNKTETQRIHFIASYWARTCLNKHRPLPLHVFCVIMNDAVIHIKNDVKQIFAPLFLKKISSGRIIQNTVKIFGITLNTIKKLA